MKGRLQAVLFGLAAAGAIRLGVAVWRGSGRVEAVLIVLVTFALFGLYYFLSYRDRNVNS